VRLLATHASRSAQPARSALDWGELGAQLAVVGVTLGLAAVVGGVAGGAVPAAVVGGVVVGGVVVRGAVVGTVVGPAAGPLLVWLVVPAAELLTVAAAADGCATPVLPAVGDDPPQAASNGVTATASSTTKTFTRIHR
jgi:hypothetical protein